MSVIDDRLIQIKQLEEEITKVSTPVQAQELMARKDDLQKGLDLEIGPLMERMKPWSVWR